MLHILPGLWLFVRVELKPSPAVNQWTFRKPIINSTPPGKHPISVWLWGSSTPVCCGIFFLNPFSLFCLHHHAERQVFFQHKLKNTRAHTHTHKCSPPYYSLLICRALIETPPLSQSYTYIPSLIISEGAFGRSKGGGGWGEDSPVSCDKPLLHSQIWLN